MSTLQNIRDVLSMASAGDCFNVRVDNHKNDMIYITKVDETKYRIEHGKINDIDNDVTMEGCIERLPSGSFFVFSQVKYEMKAVQKGDSDRYFL